jgi:hypothetical protein
MDKTQRCCLIHAANPPSRKGCSFIFIFYFYVFLLLFLMFRLITTSSLRYYLFVSMLDCPFDS